MRFAAFPNQDVGDDPVTAGTRDRTTGGNWAVTCHRRITPHTKVSKTFQRDVSLLLDADGFQAFVFFATHFRDLSMTLGPLSGVVR